MLTPNDIKELKPRFEEIHRHLNVALLNSGIEIGQRACVHYSEALLLMENVVHEAERRMWLYEESSSGKAYSGQFVREASILAEILGVLRNGGAENAETFQEFRADFEEINRRLNIGQLTIDPNIAESKFREALILIRIISYKFERIVWNQLKEGLDLLLNENTGLGKGGVVATVLGALGGGTAAASFTGLGGFGIAAGGTAVGLAGLGGGIVATGGAGLAGAAALYGLYRVGSWAVKTEQGRKAKEQAEEQARNLFEWNPWERWRKGA